MAFIWPVWGSIARTATSNLGSWSSSAVRVSFSGSKLLIFTWMTSPGSIRALRFRAFVHPMPWFVISPVYSLTLNLALERVTSRTTASMMSPSSNPGRRQLDIQVFRARSSQIGSTSSSRLSISNSDSRMLGLSSLHPCRLSRTCSCRCAASSTHF